MIMFDGMGMDCPSNIEDITDYVLEDVNDTADPKEWHTGDVAIGFRRWIESNAKAEPKECTCDNESFDELQKIAKGIIALRKIEKARAELNKQLKSLYDLPLSLLAITKDNVQDDDFEHETDDEPKISSIIGYQVVDKKTGEIHPDMDGSFCIYSLSQAMEMHKTSNNWEYLIIKEGDIEEPTMMFEGNPND